MKSFVNIFSQAADKDYFEFEVEDKKDASKFFKTAKTVLHFWRSPDHYTVMKTDISGTPIRAKALKRFYQN